MLDAAGPLESCVTVIRVLFIQPEGPGNFDRRVEEFEKKGADPRRRCVIAVIMWYTLSIQSTPIARQPVMMKFDHRSMAQDNT